MDNAAKALIIAGAILLSILIIGMGVIIFRNAQGNLQGAFTQMSELDKSTHNDKFQKHAGDRQRGSQVKTLLQELIVNVSSDDISGISVPSVEGSLLQVEGGRGSVEPFTTQEAYADKLNEARRDNRFRDNSLFKVTIDTNGRTGMVDVITIEPATVNP